MPDPVIITISNNIVVEDIPPMTMATLAQSFSMPDPSSTGRTLQPSGQGSLGTVLCPRGALQDVIGLLETDGIPYKIHDYTRLLAPGAFEFYGELTPSGQSALEGMVRHDIGILCAPAKPGRTVIALALIVERRQPALIIVPDEGTVKQWVSRIDTFLGIPARDVGIIDNDRTDPGGRVTVGTIQAIQRLAADIKRYFGHVVIDECDRIPGTAYIEAVSQFDSKYITGLSSRDDLDKTVCLYAGEIRHKLEGGKNAGGSAGRTARPADDASTTFKGKVEHVVFYKKENGYIVLSAKNGKGRASLVGTYYAAPGTTGDPRTELPGTDIDVKGTWTKNEKYGKQFKFDKLDSPKHR